MDNIWNVRLRQKRQLQCDICHLKLTNKSQMLRHRNSHPRKKNLYSKRDKNENLHLKCNKCKCKFNKKNVTQNHVVNCCNLMKTESHPHKCSENRLQYHNTGNLRRDKKSLRRKKRLHSKENNLIERFQCNNCTREFNKKESLEKHVLRCCLNLTNYPIRQVKCVECNLMFTSRSNMLRHQNSLHGNRVLYANGEYIKKPHFKCENCKRNFNRKDVLKNHILICYGLDLNRCRHFECDLCHKIFTCKSNLVRHKKLQHEKKLLSFNENYQCDTCKKSFARKDSLKRHIKNCLISKKCFACKSCNLKFENKTSKKKHEISEHTISKKKHIMGYGFKCVLCKSSFPSARNICDHIMSQHDVQLDHEHLYFATTEDFFKWKNKLEELTTSSYRKRHLKKTKRWTVCKFTCHRSGSYAPKMFDRQRKMKFYGSKKVGGYCPGEICVRIDSNNGSCKVSYVRTHMGHNISNKEIELRHIYVNKEDLGVDFSKHEYDESTDDGSVYDNDSINSNSYDIVCRRNNTTDLNAFVSQHSDSIIYYKKKSKLDDKYPFLMEDDIIIIVMTDLQKELLKKYGHNIVMLDNTYDPDTCNILMFTLLVVDDDNEGVEVAFALSNRNDQLLATVFFHCIKEIVGTVKAKTLMSDMQESYYTIWKDTMEKPKFWLFCSWYVREDWQRNLKKIRNYEKRNRVRNQLYSIASRLDENVFLSELSDLLEDKDPELTEFLTYLSKFYINNMKSWAYCYRKGADVNTNMCAEAFHSILKRFRKKKDINFDVCLRKINEFVGFKEKENRRKTFRTMISNKLRILEQNHESMENRVMEIYGSNDEGWYISFLVDENEKKIDKKEAIVNFISMNENDCGQCRLYCDKCKICAHRYECSCLHSSMTYHMCVHIHALCTFLQHNYSSIETQPDDKEVITYTSSEDIPIDSLEIITLEPLESVETKTEPSNVNLKQIKEMILEKVVNTLNNVRNEEEGIIVQKYVESWVNDLKSKKQTS